MFRNKIELNYLRSGHEIHLEQSCLESSLTGPVVFEGIEQERCALLYHVLLHKDVDNLIDIGEWLIVLDEHLCEQDTLIRVNSHDVAQQKYVVRRVGNLLRIKHDLLELAGLGEALYHFVGNVGSEVDAESEGRIDLFDEVTQLFAALQLVLLQPLLKQLLATLYEYRATQFEGFVFVQLTLVEKDTEVLEKRRCLTLCRRHLLELLDCSRST